MSELLQRRASDKEKDPTLGDIYAAVMEMKSALEGMQSAFVLDDLNKPDYAGHRLAHKQQMADAAALQKYKTGLTKSLLDWSVKGLVALILVAVLNGSMNYIKDHLK